MTDDSQGRHKRQFKTWLALATVVVILALLVVPPYISVSRYRTRITQLLSAALGRPVRISSVELRMLPRPSFVMTELVVDEDPAYGAEPVLHANTVTTAINIFPLWSGRLQISRISVDEASLNLVRSGNGRWNLDPFFRTAAARSAGARTPTVPFPYLEATNSRINVKNGVEKLPYSLVGADLSFWQDNPGEWRVRLRGQPARTDVSLDLPDTGTVRVEAVLHRAPQLRDMPMRIDLEWREAQFGQLSRLVLGSDAGWRGDLAGEMHVDGTPANAHITARLRASGVHRAEFTPASTLDFDASCSLVYHYAPREIQNMVCDSPIGSGRARVTAQLPAPAGQPSLIVEMDRVPAQVAVDALHTLRSGIDPTLQADGSISGNLSYQPTQAALAVPAPSASVKRGPARVHAPPPSKLSGALTAVGLRLSGSGLAKPLQLPNITLEPAPGQPSAVMASFSIPAGAPTPLVISARFARAGYQVTARGGISLPQLHEWSQVIGSDESPSLASLTGPPAGLDATADGPWIVAEPVIEAFPPSAALPAATPLVAPGPTDHRVANLVVHDAVWKADFLASPIELPTATLHFDDSEVHWSPVSFVYGPLKGTASLSVPTSCPAEKACPPHFEIHLGAEDISTVQAAILGARKPGTLLSSLLSHLRPASASAWPELEGTLHADSLIAGPISLYNPTATLHIHPTGVNIDSFAAGVLGGQVTGSATITPGDKPTYHLEATCTGLVAAQVGHLLSMTWSGSPLALKGQLDMTGYTAEDLAASAKGTLHFDWPHGGLTASADQKAPLALARFDHWTADADIAGGMITLRENQVVRGARKSSVEASATVADPARVTFTPAQDARSAIQ